MEKITIETEYIKLDQLLKWSGIVSSGVDAKAFILDGKIKVNGETELRRGKKIRKGDIIQFEDILIQVD